MSVISLQKAVRDNAQELQDFLIDLKRWEKEIKAEDSKLRQKHVQGSSSVDSKEANKLTDSVELEKESLKQIKNHNKTMTNTQKAEKFKEEGNKLYTSGKLEDAIAKYTEGINMDPSNHLLFANRAMAYVKSERFEEAVADCTESVKLDNKYLKAYLRRATAYSGLARYGEAIQDYKKALELEPTNKDAKKELERLAPLAKELSNVKKELERLAPLTKELSNVKKELERLAPLAKELSPAKDRSDSSDSPELHPSFTEKKVKIEETHPDEIGTENKRIVVDGGDTELESSLDLKIPSYRIERPNVRAEKTTKGKPREVSPVQITKQEKPKEPPPPPRTSHQFSQDWKKVVNHSDLAEAYLMSIPGNFFHGIEIDADQLVEVVHHLNTEKIETHVVVYLLQSLMKARGFYLNLAFLEPQQKREFESVIRRIEDKGRMNEDMRKIKNALQS